MSLDSTDEALRQESIINNMPNLDEDNFTELVTEHIYIGDEFVDQSVEPTIVTKYERINNRVHGTITDLTFFDEGFLKIREGTNKKLKKEHVLELRFLKAEPVTVKRNPTAYLWSSLGIGMLALLLSIVLPLANLGQYMISATAILATASILSLLIFVHRSEVTHQFCTASGNTLVLSLTGSLGCSHRMRAMAGEVQKAILRADAETGKNDVHYLRAEMQAHYNLAETGVITRKACSDGTTLILSKFG